MNYANDYSDGVRGTDDVRVGPVRLVASGAAAPGAVKRAGVGGVRRGRGRPASRWRRRRRGGCSPSGWRASPPRGGTPAARGPTATSGSARCSCSRSSAWSPPSAPPTSPSRRSPALSVVMGCAVGAVACALLVVNNLRDIPTDTVAGKRTLAVRLGDAATRWLYSRLPRRRRSCSSSSARSRGGRRRCSGSAAIPFAVPPVRAVRGGAAGRDADPGARRHRPAAAGVRPADHRRPGPRRLTAAGSRFPQA